MVFTKILLSRLLYTFYDSWLLPHICLQKLRFFVSENTFEMYLVFHTIFAIVQCFQLPILMQQWRDDYLMWDPADYSNITDVRIGVEKLWRPDITLHNEWVCTKTWIKQNAFMHDFTKAMNMNLVTVIWVGMCMSASCPLRVLGISNQVSRLGLFRTGYWIHQEQITTSKEITIIVCTPTWRTLNSLPH